MWTPRPSSGSVEDKGSKGMAMSSVLGPSTARDRAQRDPTSFDPIISFHLGRKVFRGHESPLL